MRWRAKEGEEYYYFGSDYDIYSDEDNHCSVDDERYKYGNYSKTEEALEEKKKKLLYQQQYKDYIGKDLVTNEDWEDISIEKYCAYYDFYEKTIKIGENFSHKYQGIIHSKYEQKIWNFIALIGEDNFKKYILEVEE